jgi:hypothetical protein
VELKDIGTIVISCAALLISLYGLQQKHTEARRGLRIQLTQPVDELNNVNYTEDNHRWQSEREGWTYNLASSANARRALLCKQEADLARKLGSDVTCVELQTVAFSLTLVGEYEQAGAMWEAAIRSAVDAPPYFRVVVKRGYASYLFGRAVKHARANCCAAALTT